MSNIYSVKFMNEASATLADKVFKKPVNETYLFSMMDILRESNKTINESTQRLYVQIAEAESKADENKILANYFYEFKNIFENFVNKVEQMKSRMVISIENKVETWEDVIKDDFIATFDKEFNYSGYEFHHMEDAEYPRLNLYKLYQKEFDYIGKLMQDSGMAASPGTKMKIIATVSNNFAKSSGDKEWIKCLIKDMVDIDEKEISRSYSECIYNSLRDKYDFNVDKGLLYTCKETVCDYEDIIDAAIKLCDCLLCDVNKVAENISSYLFRNNDKKLIIKTDTDGIIDRDYRLDTYSMNQLDLFLKNKINQIRKVLNVYAVAVGIKFDSAYDYICQCIDILNMAKSYNSDVGSDEDEEDNEIIDDVENGTADLGEDDDDLGEDDTDDLDDIDEPETDEIDEPKDDISTKEDTDDLGDLEDEEETDPIDYEGEDFEEAYLFESELFELDMLRESHEMHLAIRKALLLEEDNTTTSSTPNLQKTADRTNVFQQIIAKLIALWKKFKEYLDVNAKRRIEYLKTNAKYINDTVKGSVKLKYTPKLDELDRLGIHDLNFKAMSDKGELNNEEAFCMAHYKDYYENRGENSFSANIQAKLLGEENNITDPTAAIKTAYDFCIKYIEKTNDVKQDMNVIELAQRAAKNVANVQESSLDNGFNQYFTEFEATTDSNNNSGSGDDKSQNQGSAQNNNDDKKKSDSSVSNKLSIYFKVSSQVLAAKMSIYQKVFNEYFMFCEWYITQAGGPGYKKSNENKEENK